MMLRTGKIETAVPVCIFALLLSYLSYPGDGLDDAMMASFRGRSTADGTENMTCQALNGWSSCLTRPDGEFCRTCERPGDKGDVIDDDGASPPPGVEYKQLESTDCGSLFYGQCLATICFDDLTYQSDCTDFDTVGEQPED